MSMEARIEALERTVTRQRRAGLVLAIGGAALLLMGQGGVPKVIQAEAFVLVDKAGQTRGQLALSEDGTVSLLLKSESGTTDAGLTVLPSGTAAIRLKTPKRTAAVEVTGDGAARIRFNQAQAKTAVELGIDQTAKPRIIMNDASGTVVFQAPLR